MRCILIAAGVISTVGTIAFMNYFLDKVTQETLEDFHAGRAELIGDMQTLRADLHSENQTKAVDIATLNALQTLYQRTPTPTPIEIP